jgi:riboflavin biosynthesis pyrimidine reductase
MPGLTRRGKIPAASAQPGSIGPRCTGSFGRGRSPLRLVTFNVASIDGRIGVSRSTPSWLDARWKPLDRFQPIDVLSLHGARVSLEGSNSFTARDAPGAVFEDDAEADVPAGDFVPEKLRTHAGRWLAVIDSRARVRWTASEQDDTKLAVLISSATRAAYRQFLREHDVPYFEVGDGRVDLRQAVDRLGEAFGVDCIVSNAGGVLNGALLRAGLVDEIDIQLLPAIVGRAEAPAIFEGYDFGAANSPCDLRLIATESRPDGSIFIRYAVR